MFSLRIFALFFFVCFGFTSAQSFPSGRNLTAINGSDIPSSCQSQCPQDILTDVSTCSDLQCTCGNDTSDSLRTCTDCLVGIQALDSQIQQAVFVMYQNSCADLGITLKEQFASAALSIDVALFGVIAAVLTAAVGSML